MFATKKRRPSRQLDTKSVLQIGGYIFMASWISGTERSAAIGDFDGEQIDSPAAPVAMDVTEEDVRNYVWMECVRRGMSMRRVGRIFSVTADTVGDGITKARIREESTGAGISDPLVSILFGSNPHTPDSPCYHPDPILDGKREYCPSCHKTGIEGHPALRIRPGDMEPPYSRRAPKEDGLDGGKGRQASGADKFRVKKPSVVTDRDMAWLAQHRAGDSVAAIASQNGVTKSHVHEGIVRAVFAEKAAVA
jgi:hypothetical protein